MWRSRAGPRVFLVLLPQFAAQQGKTSQLRSAIKTHRDTWVNETDFAFMASIGVNCVRLPVGYWVLAQTQVNPDPNPITNLKT